jgi:hypothetical protein
MSQRQICINTHVPLEGSSSPRSRAVANGPACNRGARDRHHRIRSHGEQVETNVINKLRPRDRKEKAQLSAERAQKGASRLARAALLTRKFTIRHSAKSDNIAGTDPALVPAAFSQAGRRSLRCQTRSGCDQFRKWALCNSCPNSGCNAFFVLLCEALRFLSEPRVKSTKGFSTPSRPQEIHAALKVGSVLSGRRHALRVAWKSSWAATSRVHLF